MSFWSKSSSERLIAAFEQVHASHTLPSVMATQSAFMLQLTS